VATWLTGDSFRFSFNGLARGSMDPSTDAARTNVGGEEEPTLGSPALFQSLCCAQTESFLRKRYSVLSMSHRLGAEHMTVTGTGQLCSGSAVLTT
jgi:hypothetical protein